MNLSFRPTKAERNEHVARLQAIARSIAVAIDAELPLVEWEQGFLRFVLQESKGRANDHAHALRRWADSYAPTKKLPHYSHTDAAMTYALMRQEGESHYKLMLIMSRHYGITDRALEKAIWPLLPAVCEHLQLDVSVVRWRDDPPPGCK